MSRKSRRSDITLELTSFPNHVHTQKVICKKRYKTAIYARLSLEEKEEDSINTQIQLVKDYLRNMTNIDLYDIYVDNGKSGTHFIRPEFMRMMKDMQNGWINCIAVKDLSRLGRNYVETGDYLEHIFPFYGVRFIAVNDNYDSERKSDDNMMYSVVFKNLINDIYSKDISRKVRSVFSTKQKEGKYLGSFPPYGYKKDPDDRNHLIPDQETAPVVKQIFEWKAAGLPTGLIVRRLNDNKIPCVQKYRLQTGIIHDKKYESSLWSKRTVKRDILRNPVYKGTLIQGKKRSELFNGVVKKEMEEKDWIIHKGKHEALISDELFEQVQNIMDAKRQVLY